MRWGECVLRGFFFFFFSFFFALPSHRGEGRGGGGYESKKNIMNLGLGKTGNRFLCRSVSKRKSMPCHLSPSLFLFSLFLLYYPNDHTPVSQNPPPFPIPHLFFFSFLFPRISTDTLVLIPTHLPTYLQYTYLAM